VSKSQNPLVTNNIYLVSSVMKYVITTSTLSNSVTTINNCISKLSSNSALITSNSKLDNVNIIKKTVNHEQSTLTSVENTIDSSQLISVNINNNFSEIDNIQLHTKYHR